MVDIASFFMACLFGNIADRIQKYILVELLENEINCFEKESLDFGKPAVYY